MRLGKKGGGGGLTELEVTEKKSAEGRQKKKGEERGEWRRGEKRGENGIGRRQDWWK